jgi:ABC-type spermidine/putrescine transport system permease subunit II
MEPRQRTGVGVMRITNIWALILIALPLSFMAAFFLVPFLFSVIASLQNPQGDWTLENYQKIVADGYYLGIFYTTFKLSLIATILSFFIAYPIAYYIVNIVKSRNLRRFCYVLVIMPLFTSNIVRSFGWLILLGRQGLVNQALTGLGLADRPIGILFTETAVIIGLAYILVPFMVLTIAAILQTIDRSLVEASLDLGSSRLATFFHITLPLSLPGVIAGSLIVFTLAVSAYVVPAIMSGGRVIVAAMPIFDNYASLFNFNFGAALAVSLLVVTLILIALYLLFIERGQRQKSGAHMNITDRIARCAVILMAWAGLVFLTLPLVIIIATSFTETQFLAFPPVGFTFKWYGEFLRDTSYLESIWTSVAIAALATVLAISIGILAALVVSRSEIRGKRIISTVFIAPLILPTIVIGAALLQYANALGFARSFFALVIGHTVIVVPYVLRTVLASLQRFDRSLEEASHDLGGTSVSTFFLITLPIIKPGVVAGALFAFIISWINVELSIFNATAEVMPIPVKLFNYVQYAVDPMLAAVSATTIYVAIIAVIILDVFVGLDRVAASQK